MFNTKNHPDLELSQAQVVVILICVIIFTFGIALSMVLRPHRVSAPDTSSQPAVTVEERKQSMIGRLGATAGRPLTDAERVQIVQFIAHGGATYTEEEKKFIISSLRSQ